MNSIQSQAMLTVCNVIIFLALKEPSYALLPATNHPKAIRGVCHATNYHLHSQQFSSPTYYTVCKCLTI